MWDAGRRTVWTEGRLRAWGTAALLAAVVVTLAGWQGASNAASRHVAHGRHADGHVQGRGAQAQHAQGHVPADHRGGRGSAAHRSAHRTTLRPPVRRAGAPEATWSRYMHTTNPARTHRLGFQLGRRVRSGDERTDSLVVLAFGAPMHKHGRFGASLFGHFASSRRIGAAAVAYGRGFAAGLRDASGHL